MAKLVMAREERTLSAAEAAIMATAIEQAKTKALINGLAQRPKPTTEPASGDKTVLKQQYEDLVKQVYVLLKTKIELFTYQIEPHTPIERSFFSFVRLVFSICVHEYTQKNFFITLFTIQENLTMKGSSREIVS